MAELFELCRDRGTVCFVGASLAKAERLLREDGTGMLPVVDREGRLVGVLTPRLVREAATRVRTDPGKTPVHRVMSETLPCCRTWDSPSAALAMMRLHGLERLPVVDSGSRLAGIVTLQDLTDVEPKTRRPCGSGRRSP